MGIGREARRKPELKVDAKNPNKRQILDDDQAGEVFSRAERPKPSAM